MDLIGAFAVIRPNHSISADVRLSLVSLCGGDRGLGFVDDIIHIDVPVTGAHILPDDAFTGHGGTDLEEGIDTNPSLQAGLQVVHEYVIISAPVIRPGHDVFIYCRLQLF
jgi:hypothetical protein